MITDDNERKTRDRIGKAQKVETEEETCFKRLAELSCYKKTLSQELSFLSHFDVYCVERFLTVSDAVANFVPSKFKAKQANADSWASINVVFF